LAYYQSLIEALEKTLAQLDAVEAPLAAAMPQAAAVKRGAAPAKAPRAAKPAPAKTSGESKGGGRDLPFTGGDYWIYLLSDQPKTGVEILKAAVDSLGFSPNKMQVKKLSGRMIFALRTLLAAKKIKDSGSGRNRRYFRA
jgi:hypothetical protein